MDIQSQTIHEDKIRLNFDPKEKTEVLLKALPNERAFDILVRRYGLSEDKKPETLESVGKRYGITRERVRQIENHAIKALQKSEKYQEVADALEELAELIKQHGGIVPERDLIEMLDYPDSVKQHILFLLHVGEPFRKHKETREFSSHWYLDETQAKAVRDALRKLTRELSEQVALPEEEILEKYAKHLAGLEKDIKDERALVRWLILSKQLSRNPLGEWGLSNSPAVKVKGIRDFAYLALRRHGSPMHFREVAQAIEELFGKKANPATTHNELIKDPRFVLVGRGLYALAEWGYTTGPVKEVIKNILKKEGPLTKQEIIERVKRERYVKDNTIGVNLQDSNTFERLPDGRFTLKSEVADKDTEK